MSTIFTYFVMFLKTSRPRFWIYLVWPYLIWIIAWSQISESTNPFSLFSSFSLFSFLSFLIYFSYPANLLVYGVNDIFDYETDKLNEKKTGYEWLIGPDKKTALWISIFLLNAPFLLLSILPNSESYLRLFLFLLSSLFYSAPPLRAKAKPILDTIVSAFVYISPWFVWYYISWWSDFDWFIFISLLARNMAMHAYSAIPDIEADTQAWLQTVATFYGKKGTLWFCIICYLLAIICALPSLGRFGLVVWWVYLAMMIATFRSQVFRLYKLFPWINTAVGFVLFWYVLAWKIWYR